MLFNYPLFTNFGYYSHVFDVYSTFIQTFGSYVEWLTQGMVVKHGLCIDCSLKMILLTFFISYVFWMLANIIIESFVCS